MAMTFGDMQTFVRAQADADTTDAPPGLLQVHARIAYNDILARKNSWDHLEVKYTLTTVAGQNTYALSSLTGGADMDRVYSITSQTPILRRLAPMTRSDADLTFGVTAQQSSTPIAYVLSNQSIILYPTPSGVQTLNVLGFRANAVWPNGDGSIPDLPDEFHDAIAWYMLSGYYLSQEDQGMSGMYLQEYNQLVERYLNGISNTRQLPRPMILGGSMALQRPLMERVKGMLE